MKKKIRELFSLETAKNPGRIILLFILLLNVVFFLTAAFIIYQLAPESLNGCNYWETVFYTVTMVLDAGCIQFIVSDASATSAVVIVVCLFVIIFGMIIFTGAVIGYLTNYISTFIANSNEGRNILHLSDHTIILNWNSRASEIINDLYYSERAEKVVVLVGENRKQVEKEIELRLADTESKEKNELLKLKGQISPGEYSERKRFIKRRLSVIVREGETYSTKELMDISIPYAKAVIILGKDFANSQCKYAYSETVERNERGNADVIKTLIQVAELTGAETSADDQHIIVEVEDDWTLELVNKIIEHKEKSGKCNIVPVAVNRVLGQILSQFSIMPELNLVYQTLFSNKGVAFYCNRTEKPDDENKFLEDYMDTHRFATPLGFLDTKEGMQSYYVAGSEDHLSKKSEPETDTIPLKLAKFKMRHKNVIILGHNSKSHYIMEGFNSFRSEWNNRKDGKIVDEIMDIMVIDDADSLKKHDYYKDYPMVTSFKEASVYDHDEIIAAINSFIAGKTEDTSILILSDDHTPTEELDGNALIYLIYVEEIIQSKLKADPNFDIGSIDVVVEILNPKNSDVARSYSVDNVVISNRYVSKMMTQISEKQALFEFYNDILTYDSDDVTDAAEAEEDEAGFESKEVYAKPVRDFFEEIPGKCTAGQLVRSVFAAGPENNKTIVIGYVKDNRDVILFDGDMDDIYIELHEMDKIIVYTNH